MLYDGCTDTTKHIHIQGYVLFTKRSHDASLFPPHYYLTTYLDGASSHLLSDKTPGIICLTNRDLYIVWRRAVVGKHTRSTRISPPKGQRFSAARSGELRGGVRLNFQTVHPFSYSSRLSGLHAIQRRHEPPATKLNTLLGRGLSGERRRASVKEAVFLLLQILTLAWVCVYR